jgi:hypothetical protein
MSSRGSSAYTDAYRHSPAYGCTTIDATMDAAMNANMTDANATHTNASSKCRSIG